jgi:hypothetical protein
VSRRLPALILTAQAAAGAWRVTPAERGFSVWRFRPWRSRYGGWSVEATSIATREEAWVWILRKLDLADKDPPSQTAKPQTDPYVWRGFDFSGM